MTLSNNFLKAKTSKERQVLLSKAEDDYIVSLQGLLRFEPPRVKSLLAAGTGAALFSLCEIWWAMGAESPSEFVFALVFAGLGFLAVGMFISLFDRAVSLRNECDREKSKYEIDLAEALERKRLREEQSNDNDSRTAH